MAEKQLTQGNSKAFRDAIKQMAGAGEIRTRSGKEQFAKSLIAAKRAQRQIYTSAK